MAMVVRTNAMAYNANRQLGMNNSAVSKNLEKLSSGFKINRAADDAAGLAVSEKMKAQIKGLEQASLNSQDGISLVQTAEGALTEVHDMLNRMTELATKSANGTIQDDVDRDAIQNEVNKLNEEIDRISQSTNFNGINLLDGSLSGGGVSGNAYSNVSITPDGGTAATVTTVAGATASSQITFGTLTTSGNTFTVEMEINVDGKLKKVNYSGKSSGSTDILSDTDFIKAVQDAVGDKYAVKTSGTGVLVIEASGTGNDKVQINAGVKVTDAGAVVTTAAIIATTVGKADVLQVGITMTTVGKGNVIEIDGKKFQILKQGETADKGMTAIYTDDGKVNTADQRKSVAAQLKNYGVEVTVNGSNFEFTKASATAATSSSSSGGLTLQIGDTGDDFNQVSVSVADMSAKGIGTKGLDVSTQDAAKAAIETIRSGINMVSTNRSEMGALQNRLEHAINNLDVAAENMTSANSRIRDTDMAKQMMEYTKMNVLTQSAQAMLAQANQNPQSILQLLQ